MPGLGSNLFSVKQAGRNSVVSIFDMTNPRLETHNHTFPLGHTIYYFSLDIAGGGNGPELVMQAVANTNLWHWRPGHLNCKSLRLLDSFDNNGVSFDGPVPDCDACVGVQGHQRPHPNTANHKVKLPFRLIFADLMGPLTPEALGGYKYITKRVHQVDGALFAEFQARRSQLISGIRTICGDFKWFPRRAVEGGQKRFEFISKEF